MEIKRTPDNPLVTVIIPCFNSELWIADCLKSVYSQTYRELEIILVDDGSTDLTSKIIHKIKKTNTRYYYKSNGGVSSARNVGIEKAKGELIAFLDSDDFWHKRKIEIQVNLIKKGFDFTYSDYDLVDAQNTPLIGHSTINPLRFKHPIKKMLLSENIVAGGSSVLLKRSVLDTIGNFREDVTIGEDWELWTRVLWQDFKPYFINKKLTSIRRNAGSAQLTTDNKIWKKSIETVLISFLELPNISKKEKSIVFRRLFLNSYRFDASFYEGVKYRFKSCYYSPLLMFNLTDNKTILKFVLKKLLY